MAEAGTHDQLLVLSPIKILLLGICVTLGNVVLGYNASNVMVSLDGIASSLKVADRDLQWVGNSFVLAFGCTTLVSGRAADIFAFFVSRGLTGVGAAMICASNLGLLVENTKPGRTRSLLVSVCNAGLALGNAFGLGVAGPLVQATEWRASLWVLAGFTGIPMVGTSLLVKRRAVNLRQTDKRIDWLGTFLFVAGFILLFYSLSQARSARHGWATNYIIALFVLSIVAIACVLGWQWYLETKTSFPPVLRVSILTRRRGRLALVCLVIFSCMGATSGHLFTTTIFYQRYQNLTPSEITFRFLPGPIAGVLFGVVVGICIGHVPSHWFLGVGTILTGAANVLYATKKEGATYWTSEFFAQMLLYGGPGLAASTGFIYVTKVVKPAEVAVGNACLQFWPAFGGACGAAFSTLVYSYVGNLDVSTLGDTSDERKKQDLLRGLKASYWFWAALCFFAAVLTFVLLRDSKSDVPEATTQVDREVDPVVASGRADKDACMVVEDLDISGSEKRHMPGKSQSPS